MEGSLTISTQKWSTVKYKRGENNLAYANARLKERSDALFRPGTAKVENERSHTRADLRSHPFAEPEAILLSTVEVTIHCGRSSSKEISAVCCLSLTQKADEKTL